MVWIKHHRETGLGGIGLNLTSERDRMGWYGLDLTSEREAGWGGMDWI
jgi:hypothetical protein